MPISNCTEEDIGYDIDTPGDPGAQALLLSNLSFGAFGASLAFLVCFLVSGDQLALVLAILSLLAGVTLYFVSRPKVGRVEYLDDVEGVGGKLKRLLRAGTYHNDPLRFGSGSKVVFCSRSGDKIAEVEMQASSSQVTVYSGTGATRTTPSTSVKPVAPPVGLVMLHESGGAYDIDVLPQS